jgi:cytochrome c
MNLALRLLLSLLPAMPLAAYSAQPDADPQYQAQADKAHSLLQKAVTYYKEKGDSALATFSRQGDFVDGELYVFVIDTKGVMLASGGPSVVLVGRNVLNTVPEDLKSMFATAVNQPEGQVHDAQYRWTNANDGKVERKQVYFQRVGTRVLGVGYYMPRSSPAEAIKLLDHASAAIGTDPTGTFKAINNLDPHYYQDDLYVFAVDLKTLRFIAHGYNRRLIGTDFQSLKSADGKPIGQNMLDAINRTGHGDFDYLWRNPVTNRNEHKHAYLNKVGNYLVAVGYYQR